jgi:hypothetical protein
MRVMAVALASLMVAAPALAQSGQQRMEAAGASFEDSMAAAQAVAARPGDELLTCEAIQAEMVATMSDPAMQSQIAELGANAEAQQQRSQEQQDMMRGMMMTGVVTSVIGSFVPGAGYAQSLAMQAQAQRAQAQADAGMGENAEMLASMEQMMPQMMRGQRLYELAQAQECAFLQEMEAQAPQ